MGVKGDFLFLSIFVIFKIFASSIKLLDGVGAVLGDVEGLRNATEQVQVLKRSVEELATEIGDDIKLACTEDGDACVKVRTQYKVQKITTDDAILQVEQSIAILTKLHEQQKKDLLLTLAHLLQRILFLFGVWRRKSWIFVLILIGPVIHRPLLVHLKVGVPEDFQQQEGFIKCLIEFILSYPIVDHFTDHPYYLKMMVPEAERDNMSIDDFRTVGYTFFIIHVIFYKFVFNCFQHTRKSQQQLGLKPKVKPIRILPNVYPEWYLHSCLYDHKKNLKTILKLFGSEIDINMKGPDGNTGLHLAIITSNFSIVQILTANNRVNILLGNDEGLTPLDLVVIQGHELMFKHLISLKRFKWINVDVQGLVRHAIDNKRFSLASKIMSESDIRNVNPQLCDLHVFIRRCQKLQEELHGPGLTTSKQNHIHLCLEAYHKYFDQILHTTHPQEDQEPKDEVMEHFECPVCVHEMIGVPIFSCSRDHWICSECLNDPRMNSCPMCREDFGQVKPRRCLTAEKIALTIQRRQCY